MNARRPASSPPFSARGGAVGLHRRTVEARAVLSTSEAMIAHLRLEIAKLRREQYGRSSERRARLIEQMELQLEELEVDARDRGGTCRAEDHERRGVRTPPPDTQAVSGPFAARTRRHRTAHDLSALRFGADREDGRGHDRDTGTDPPSLEGDPDRAGEVHLPGVREDQPTAGAIPRNAARMGWAEPPGLDPVREVRPASAAEPSGRALCPGGCRSQPVDAGRPGRRLRRRPAADP